MKATKMLTILVLALCLIVFQANVSEAEPMGTAWTYQGRLIDADIAADGLHDFEFKLYDKVSDGNQLASTIDVNELDVIDGYFTVVLDFGSGVFEGDARWLEIGVRPGGSVGAFTPLSPRQELTLTPYALYAVSSGGFPVPLLVSGSSLAPIIEGINTGSGVGVRGHASSSAGDGMYGTAAGGSGRGVVGVASNGGDVENYGGFFIAAGDDGRGVYGYASDGGNGMNYGGYFKAAGKYGRGVYGEATGESGWGVRGETVGKYGIGVQGTASGEYSFAVYGYASKTGNVRNYGGRFTAAGDQGRGVSGIASATGLDVENYGGYFTAAGRRGRGVYAEALPTSGTGENYGGYFLASGGGKGVYAEAGGTEGIAVQGLASREGSAVNYGGHFTANGDCGRGVYGCASYSNGPNFGGYFEAAGYYGNGVYGKAPGLDGTGAHGVATGGNGRGVAGWGQKYDFYAEGPGTNYGSPSSIRWKSNVRPIDDPLGKLMSLRGVYFDWDSEHGGHHDVGMVAEEVGEVLPEIVQYEENGIDATGMDYGQLTPLLVEAVKELKGENDRLKERVEALERTIHQLAKVKELEL